jgi:hypothetical protein
VNFGFYLYALKSEDHHQYIVLFMFIHFPPSSYATIAIAPSILTTQSFMPSSKLSHSFPHMASSRSPIKISHWNLFPIAILYDWFRIASKCLITVKFASKNRSTQFCAQLSSFFSSLPLRIEPVMHLRQQMSVRLCTAKIPR